MPDPTRVNADQLAFWNGVGGRTWVERQDHTDRVLEPVTRKLLSFAAPRPGERVLDVGCGCGASTLEVARAVGPSGRVRALDISAPMLAEAAARAEARGLAHIDWLEADAATAELDEYDLLVSNCGLMFFGDPVPAFVNLHRAAAPGARMVFVCWRGLDENPWIGVPMQAVLPHIPPRPKGDPRAPGMFAFAEPDHVTEILTEAGWKQPRLERLDVTFDIAAGGGIDEALTQLTKIGAINSWLRDQPEETHAAAVASMREALTPYVQGQSVLLSGAMWMVASQA
ncbi:class I SAM-dependent methyltransferase [Roseibium sp.]|uniref:class I SAM-dependent methyltransferase n=1 Tax=Roseibium sp. TaxID=1936156 RepID=UPI003D0EEE80